ncbi:putative bifunctional diguanylate cyclase/phosphodiesterase [Kiloniella laminariae]|uniref:putative bifunctional diguanylate cyclase/phosphodiesterase n=1 Tax=Kiloniella laminariae TaxID=454162 RepID=UPI0012FA3928|nr:EAL domain-containing protein [Kiloniella laminariae]
MQRSPRKDNALAQLDQMAAALDASGDVMYEWDLATDSLVWLGRSSSLFGLDDKVVPVSGETYHNRINPEDLPARMRNLTDHFAGEAYYDCEYRVRDGSGNFQWVHDRGAVEVSTTGAPTRLTGVLRPVTIRKQAEARLEYLASYDELSGHFNKLRLRESLDFSLEQSIRYKYEGAFLAVGVDHLGMINTAYGFEAGDSILVEVGERLDKCIRGADIVGRLGGDRFGVIMSVASNEEADAIADRILQTVRETPFEVNEQRIYVTVSIGQVFFPEQTKTSFDAFAKAESALLGAKSNGRDCVKPYKLTIEQCENYRTSMVIGEEVKLALKEDRLALAYQPIVNADTHEMVLVEALLRMYDRNGDIVPAGVFIPVVEQLGMMRVIDRRVLELALQDLAANPDITMALNISGLTASDRGWLRALSSRVKARPDLAERLIVEITETAALHDLEESARFVSSVRQLGCKVAIDDFGAGYTTFRHLKTLTVDIIKIDGSFISGILENEENQIFVRNLLSLAKALNHTTIAEFVETAEEAEFLAREGVDLLQGYHFGKPEISPDWLEKNSKQSELKVVSAQGKAAIPA